MRNVTHTERRLAIPAMGLVLVGLFCLGMASCRSSNDPSCCVEPQLPSHAATPLAPGWPRAAQPTFVQVCYQAVRGTVPTVAGAEMVNDDEICMTCHGTYVKTFQHDNVHRNNGCESCHGPASKHVEARGKQPGLIFSFKGGDPAAKAEACLKCHEQNQCSAGAQWRTSKHAQCGVTCVACHRAHYNVPFGTPATTEPQVSTDKPADSIALASFNMADAPKGGKPPLPSLRGTSHNLAAVAPGVCFRCHSDKQDLARIAGPHQIGGPNGFNCTTCHDPHGQIKEHTRKDLCLTCHKGAPTMAWHSSVHAQYGVACTDCHNPHPCSKVQQFVDISHSNIVRPQRMPMAVDEPFTCYKCHPKVFALNQLPSHHPIKEGKMVCSDCHDPHGQQTRGLKADTVNLLCYKCHAEKQGPFAYPHPPVTENCAICHEPHGTVANNLLRQPPVFLCLRCHVGHRGLANNGHPSVSATAIDTQVNLRQPLYTNCTQCHTQIHGTDVPSPTEPNSSALFR